MSNALVILAEGFEEIEAVTVIDLLRRANVSTTVASLWDARLVNGAHQIPVQADCSLEEIIDHPFDLLVLPGGIPGADNLAADNRVIELIQQRVSNNQLVSAICAAPKILAKAGVLKDKQATSYPGVLTIIRDAGVHISDQGVCVDIPLVTATGVGTAIPFALTLIGLLENEQTAQSLADAILFN